MLILVKDGEKVKAINLEGSWTLEIDEFEEKGTVKLKVSSSFGSTVIMDLRYAEKQEAIEKARRAYACITDAYKKGDALLELDISAL